MDLARLTSTPTATWDAQSCVFDEDGRLLPAADGERCSELMWGIVLQAFKHSEECSAEISPEESLFDFFQSRVVEAIPETEADYERRRELVLQMAESWGAFVGSPVTTQSLKYFWLEECIEGGMMHPPIDSVNAVLGGYFGIQGTRSK